jgi:hypothetical protein
MPRGRPKKVKSLQTLPRLVTCYIFQGDRGLTWWQDNWPPDAFDLITESEGKIKEETATKLGARVLRQDPNDKD